MAPSLENIILPKHPEDGSIYEAVFHAGSPDWETGYTEEWEWELVLNQGEKEG